MRCRTVLISPQTLLRDALSAVIRRNGHFDLAADLATVPDIQQQFRSLRPELVVLDVADDLSSPDVIEQFRHLRKHYPSIRWIALFDTKNALVLNLLLEAGVHWCVGRDQSCEILLEAMIEVAAGGKYDNLLLSAQALRIRSTPDSFVKILSFREQEILRYVAAGYTSKAIAGKLKLSYRSVQTHRYRIMKRLDVKSVAALLHYLHRHGIIAVNQE